MFDYLDGFEERMKFVAVVDSIVNRKGTNSEIENWFVKNELDNIFFSLLLYIMEQTLNDNNECTMENMTNYIEKILPYYHKKFSYNKAKQLTEYMVKDILQNKGEVKNFHIMNYSGGMKSQQVRLIKDKLLDDNTIVYELADPGYDFLFRTREIDKELDFKLEQMKLKELLKRKNYKHAVVQSKNLISMLRQKEKELEDFISRVRQNIHEVDKSEYENILKETYALIDEEYQGMTSIKISVEQDETRIKQVQEENGYLDETMIDAMDNLIEIKQNILLIMAGQRNLIAKRFTMNSVYEEIIHNSFYASIAKRYDFEKEVLEPITTITEKDIPSLYNLLIPFYRPSMNKILNLETLYQRQGKIREEEEETLSITYEEIEENELLAKTNYKNEINFSIVEHIFQYAAYKKCSYTFSELYKHLESKVKDIRSFTKDKQIFLIIFKLYDLHEVDLSKWKDRVGKDDVIDANGEFDLEWSLYRLEQLYKNFLNINKLVFEKLDDKIIIELTEEDSMMTIKNTIEMNDIVITPFMKAGAEDE